MSTPTSDIAYLSRALKTPRIRESVAQLADQVRDSGWSHEEYLASALATEVASREASGAAIRIHAAGKETESTSGLEPILLLSLSGPDASVREERSLQMTTLNSVQIIFDWSYQIFVHIHDPEMPQSKNPEATC